MPSHKTHFAASCLNSSVNVNGFFLLFILYTSDLQFITALQKWPETLDHYTSNGVIAVQHWLLAHGLPKLAVTNVKDSQMTALWDDKAIRVVKNTGKPCYACAGVNCFSAQEEEVLTDC
ncbi:hypothetical protein [Candidatus Regiella endosymbiont of Tuberolachnus salignus]|uniref:hypothetical protein n=1 Tax=Candidatus Regiella endosymbiont of Tuberolachnus salignus TaxID=3077956 RepID=UPI0030D62C8E